MKKRLLCLLVIISMFMVVGCEKKERTIEYLMDRYVEVFTKADMNALKEMFPPFYVEYSKNSITKEALESQIKNAKETYGNDYTITYKIGNKTKLTDKELQDLNKEMISIYKAKDNAKECYKYNISISLKGSKKEDSLTYETMGYCNYDGTWYLVAIK